MASSNQLQPHEIIWAEGLPAWVPAAQVTELGFLQRKPRGFSSLGTGKKATLIAAALSLFLAPGWFVFRSNYDRIAEEQRQADLKRQDEEAQRQHRMDDAKLKAAEDLVEATKKNTDAVLEDDTRHAVVGGVRAARYGDDRIARHNDRVCATVPMAHRRDRHLPPLPAAELPHVLEGRRPAL